MNNSFELKWNELKLSYQPSDFSFTATKELFGSNGIIGQENAIEAFKQGLRINAKGYNIYICGEGGVGKWSAIMKVLGKYARNRCVPQDICYVYHFTHPETPQLLLLKSGEGKKFKEDMDEWITFIVNELPLKLESKETNQKRKILLDNLEQEKEKLLSELSEKAAAMDILVKITQEGLGFAPLGKDGDIITKEEYHQMSQKQKLILDTHLKELYSLADEIIERVNNKEKQCLEELDELNKEIFIEETGWGFKRLKEKYRHYAKISHFLEEVCADLIEHLDLFIEKEDKSSGEMKQLLQLTTGAGELQKLIKRYKVNLLVDHSETQGAPIITDTTLEQNFFAGRILLDSELNMLRSEFNNIRAGLFHKANGGYLVLRVQSLLENFQNWLALKKMLKTGYIPIENAEDMNLITVSALRPEPLEAQIKVILLGNYSFYKLLSEHDEDFKKLFKMRINFDDEIDSNSGHNNRLAVSIKKLCDDEGLPPISPEGLIKIIEHGNRLTQNPKKLPANIGTLLDLVREASVFAKEVIDVNCIEKAVKQRHDFKLKIEKRIYEKIAENQHLIDTQGKKIGQVNGLAVYEIDDYMFGSPVKITATTYKGQSGIIDIEKECGLGGEIHTKGVQIITGFLGSQFAQDTPLSLNCNICFEQSYSGIDGDSASSAELYAILSSLSEIPIKQCIAATGSVNQYGQIQPIGGVNEKIEGFFKLCKERGLSGNEGVLIPIQNSRELMLEDEVVEAVKNNLFHVYAVSSIREGMEIITGQSYDDIETKVKEKVVKLSKGYYKN